MAVEVKITGDISNLQKGLKTLTSDMGTLQKEAQEVGTKTRKSFADVTKEVSNTAQSLGEMRRELRNLRNVSFIGLDPEHIKYIRSRMAELTDGIGDFQAQVRTASADRIPALINGLQGIVAITQGVTASLGLFGVENEKLEKSMVQLIGASQALTTVYDLYEKQTLKVTASHIKEIAAKTGSTIATSIQTAVVSGATVAQKALNIAMLACPYVLIGTAIAGLAYAFATMSEEAELARISYEVWANRSRKLMLDLADATKKANEIFDSVNKQIEDFNDRNLTAGEKAQKQYILIAELQKQATVGMISQLEVKRQLISAEIEHGEAMYTWMQFIPEQGAIMRKGLDDLIARESKLAITIEESKKKYKEESKNITERGAEIKKSIDLIDEIRKKESENEKNSKKADEDKLKREADLRKARLQNIADYNAIIENGNKVFQQEIANGSLLSELENDKASKAIETAKAREEAERKYTQTATEALEEQFKNGEIGWSEYYVRLEVLEDEALQAKIKKFQEYTQTIKGGLQDLTSIATNLREIEQNELSSQIDADNKALEDSYAKKLADAGNNAYQRKQVDDWYNAQKTASEAKQIQQSEALAKKYKNIQKGLAIGTAITDGALAISNIWAIWASNPIVASALTILAAANTATQIGVISSQKFEKGGTGVIDGKSHRSGGTQFFGGEAEKDERWAIFSKEATSRNTGLEQFISAINNNRLVIDKDKMSSLLVGGNGKSNIMVVANFQGGEDLQGMHKLMRKNNKERNIGSNIYVKGIIKRTYLN